MNKEKLHEYIKDCYLSGLSYSEIICKVKEKYKKNLSKSTISDWSKRFGWENLKKEAAMKGVSAAIDEVSDKNKKDVEETLKDKISDKYYKQYSENEKIRKECVDYIRKQFSGEDIDPIRLKAVSSVLSGVTSDMRKLEEFLKTELAGDVNDDTVIILS